MEGIAQVSRETMRTTTNLMREWNGLEPIAIEKEAALNFKNRTHAKKLGSDLGDLPTGEPISEQIGLELRLT